MPWRTCARIAASAFAASPDTSAAASSAWKRTGSGARRTAASNCQLKISTWLRSIIWRSSALRRPVRDLHVQLHVPLVHLEAKRGVRAVSGQPIEQAIDLARDPLDRPALGRRRPFGEQPRRLRLERLSELVQLTHVGVARHADAGAGAGPRFEEAILLQPPQRIRDRQDAHPQLARDAASRHRRAGGS